MASVTSLVSTHEVNEARKVISHIVVQSIVPRSSSKVRSTSNKSIRSFTISTAHSHCAFGQRRASQAPVELSVSSNPTAEIRRTIIEGMSSDLALQYHPHVHKIVVRILTLASSISGRRKGRQLTLPEMSTSLAR